MIKTTLGLISHHIVVDPGTTNTLVFVRGRGVVCREPSVIAVREDRRGGRQVIAVGTAARAMWGRTPPEIKVIRPIREGLIADFEAAEAMLRYFVERVQARRGWVGPRMVVCIPYGTTEVERRAVRECAESAGASQVQMVEAPLAAALGAELDVNEPRGNMIVDIGGGTTQVAVISMADTVYSRTLPVAGEQMDAAIIRFLEHEHRLLIGPRTAEEVKIALGHLVPEAEPSRMVVRGRHMDSGYPSSVELDSTAVAAALEPPVVQILDAIRGALEHTPPELASDIVERGVVVTGGCALMSGFVERIREATGLPVICVDDPLASVALGAGRLMEDLPELETALK